MSFRLYSIAASEREQYYFTPCPEIDSAFWGKQNKHIVWLSNPQPIGKLFPLYNEILANYYYPLKILNKVKALLGVNSSSSRIEVFQKKLGKAVPPLIIQAVPLPQEDEKNLLFRAINGKILYKEEILRAVKEYGFSFFAPIEHILQMLYLEGKLDILPALYFYRGKQGCYRCGETKNLIQVACSACHDDDCRYCETCVGMGQARLCKELYAVRSFERPFVRRVDLNLDFELTKPQIRAYKKSKEFINSNSSSAVIWAACGAGKTEVSFGAIKGVLEKGGKVLYAIPRKDTVIELEPRIRKAFPDSKVVALYGGSPKKFETGDIVLATTHQSLRLYRAFNLVVLDEADAFPYEGSAMLYLAVERARVDNGKIIYMTATPTEKMLQKVKAGQNPVITVPARHHGHPLPEPQCITDRKQSTFIKEGKLRVMPKVVELIKESVYNDKAQVFVFVPTIALAKPTAAAIAASLGSDCSIKIDYSHSRDKARDAKRDSFAKGEIHVFVTTSIMERGITVPRANVMVMFADYSNIYSWRALLQMAGRSGRKSQYPTGKVWFISRQVTPEMQKALKIIKDMNKEAKDNGYIE